MEGGGRGPRRGLVAAGLAYGPALATLACLGVFAALDLAFPLPPAALEPPLSTVVLDRTGRELRWVLSPDEKWRFPVDLETLPPELPEALVAVEDRRFRSHHGVDPLALLRAAFDNLRSGRVVSGASTITMQIARMSDPAPRTLAAKLREGFRALQLERRYSKDALLELYLRIAPYGRNLEGVAAASRVYFGKPPERLALGEIALLVALPRSPAAYDPVRHPEAAARARDRVLSRLVETGFVTAAQARRAVRVPLPTAAHPPPFRAPHFTELALARHGASTRGGGALATSLDPVLQSVAERLLARRVGELRSVGIDQGAVVVLDLDHRSVAAMVGSADFFDAARQGQVNGATARRSPGSTLKPLLYGLAFDTGLIVPESYLLDVPTDYAGYVAENYDGVYNGRVTARTALVRSLNAPAVRLLARVGLEPFHELLVAGGLETLDRRSGDYGLPLVLGAGEVTLLDLTNLYATLGRDGSHRPVALLASGGERGGAGDRLLSREASWLLTEVLEDVRRPDLPEAWELTRDVPSVAWKTGTSYGHRDAWAVGYSRDHAIGVWVGNFDGRPRPGISGSEHAAPLLFDLFRAVEPGGGGPVRPPGLDLEPLEVCSLSHRLAGPHCPERTTVTYLPGRSRLGRCEMHRRYRSAAACGGGGDFRTAVVHPAELLAWWRSEGRPVVATSDPGPGCPEVALGEAPRIVSPDPATPYRLRRGIPLSHQRIALVARVGSGARHLWWYEDGLLVGAGAPGERLFVEPSPGRHRLVVTDDLGRSAGTSFLVEAAP